MGWGAAAAAAAAEATYSCSYTHMDGWGRWRDRRLPSPFLQGGRGAMGVGCGGGAFSPAPFDPCVRVRVSECELPVSPSFPLFLVAARGIILHRRRRLRRSMRGEEEEEEDTEIRERTDGSFSSFYTKSDSERK